MIMEYILQPVVGKATVSNHSPSTLDPGPLAWHDTLAYDYQQWRLGGNIGLSPKYGLSSQAD